MDGYGAGDRLAVASASPQAEEAIAAVRDDAYAGLRTPSGEEDCDDLYGDVNVGFLPLLPLSPPPAPPPPPPTPPPPRPPRGQGPDRDKPPLDSGRLKKQLSMMRRKQRTHKNTVVCACGVW